MSKSESTTGSFAVRDARGNTVNIAQRLLQYALVQEHQRIQRLILGRRGNIAVHRQVSPENANFRRPHIARVPLTMEVNKPSHPVHVGLLCPYAVMRNTGRIPHLGHKRRRFQSFPPPDGSCSKLYKNTVIGRVLVRKGDRRTISAYHAAGTGGESVNRRAPGAPRAGPGGPD